MATNKKPRPMQARIIKAHEPTQPLQPIKKAEGPTQVSEQEAYNAGDWIEPPAPLAGLHMLKKEIENGGNISQLCVDLINSGMEKEGKGEYWTSHYRARKVAVTEVLRAHSVAQHEAYMQSPAVESKSWRHTGNYRNEPRQNHVDMDGQVVLKDQPFELVGADGMIYYPMYPRDTSLPAAESINCHCIEQPVVDMEILGLPLEERQKLQQQAIDEMDDDWEAELDAQNKAKAGIEDD